MTGLIGADTQQMREFAASLTQSADRIERIIADLSGAFNRTYWDGDDGIEIGADWRFKWSGQLRLTAEALRQASTTVTRNADAQDVTSETDGPGGPGLASQLFTDLQRAMAAGSLMIPPNLLEALADEHFEDLLKKAHIPTDSALYKRLMSLHDGAVHLKGQPLVDFLLKDRQLVKDAEDAKGLAKVMSVADKVGPLAILGTGVDAATLGVGLYQGIRYGNWNRDTLNAGADTIFDVASIATLECPPLSVGIDIVHFGYDMAFEPQFRHDVIQGVTTVAHVIYDVDTAPVKFVASGVEAAGNLAHNVISGGVNAVSHLFHW